jgi:hypothetical protein
LILSAMRGPFSDIGMLSSMVFTATAGIAMLAVGALQLPSWARTRSKQMEEIAGRLAQPDEARDRIGP